MKPRRPERGGPSRAAASGRAVSIAWIVCPMDWSVSSLGPPEQWPQSLRTAFSICDASRFPMAICWGPDLNILYNEAYSPILGSKHPWALGRPCYEVWSELRPIIEPMFDSVLQTGQATWSDDLLLPMQRHGYTEEAYFTVSYSPIRDERGQIGGIFVTVTETTERVLAARRVEALRELAAEAARARSSREACDAVLAVLARHTRDVPFAALYGAAACPDGPQLVSLGTTGLDPDALARIDALATRDGTPGSLGPMLEPGDPLVIDAAEAGLRTIGEAPTAVTQLVVLRLSRPGTGEASGALVAGVNPHRALDGDYRTFLTLVGGHVAAALANATAYEEERRRAEALAELDRAKTTFFSNVSHEFRTPLTLLLGPLEDALTRGALSGADLETAHRNAMRLLKLVNGLLDFARIEAGRMEASFRPTDLAGATAHLASAFRSGAERAGLSYDVDCPPLREPVYVDADLWEKIVLNLLSNAFKFTLTGGIRVALREAGDHAELEVADTGAGIPPAELPRLFERFHRIEGVPSRTHEGTGIGLALVNDLVRLHGGRIEVRSTPGAGTTFFVRLPFGTAHLPPEQIGTARTLSGTATGAAPFVEEALRWLPDGEPDPLLAAGAAAPPVGHAVPARILVADDNADMRGYLARLLSAWTVEAVADGAAALAAAERERPDLVIADVMMPGLDGFALLRALRARDATQSVPVILLSARAGEESRVEGLERGADDYVTKPFSARELIARVSAHIELGRLRRLAEIDRAHLYGLFDRAPAAIAVMRGPRHVVEFANQRYCEISGRTRAEVLDRPVLDIFPELAGTPVMEVLDSVHATGRTVRSPEFEVTWHRDRSEPPVTAFMDWTCQAVPNAAGAIDGTAQFFFDVTELVRARHAVDTARRTAEMERRSAIAARGEAEAANRAKDEFLAMLGHELRNPLSPIVTALQLLNLRGVRSREHAVIERQVRHLSRLVDDLLDVSRITQGRVEIRREPVDLAHVATRAVETVAPLLDERRQRLAVQAPEEQLLVMGDGDRLTQVVANLLANASKYSDEASHIWLTIERLGGRAVVRVRDEGIGIEAGMLESIFLAFVRDRQAVDRASSGLGLGLAIAHSLVQLHGGTIRAASEGPGKGSEFAIDLPLHEASPEAAA